MMIISEIPNAKLEKLLHGVGFKSVLINWNEVACVSDSLQLIFKFTNFFISSHKFHVLPNVIGR